MCEKCIEDSDDSNQLNELAEVPDVPGHTALVGRVETLPNGWHRASTYMDFKPHDREFAEGFSQLMGKAIYEYLEAKGAKGMLVKKGD